MTDNELNDDGTAVNPPLPDYGPTDGTHGEGVDPGEGVDESPGERGEQPAPKGRDS